jgi:hypothetical protein
MMLTPEQIEAARGHVMRTRRWLADNVTALDDADDMEHKIRVEELAEVAGYDAALDSLDAYARVVALLERAEKCAGIVSCDELRRAVEGKP